MSTGEEHYTYPPSDGLNQGGPPPTVGTTAADHPTHPWSGDVYHPTGQAPMLRELSSNPPHPHDLPPREEPLAKFGPHLLHVIPHRGGSLEKLVCRGQPPRTPPLRRHTPRGEESAPNQRGAHTGKGTGVPAKGPQTTTYHHKPSPPPKRGRGTGVYPTYPPTPPDNIDGNYRVITLFSPW